MQKMQKRREKNQKRRPELQKDRCYADASKTGVCQEWIEEERKKELSALEKITTQPS